LNPRSHQELEQALLERCRQGDRVAQRELYEQTSDRIYRLLLKMTGNRDDAEELHQDTFVKGFERLDSFDGRSAVATWLYKIGVNEALLFLRRARNYRVKLESIAQTQAQSNGLTTVDANTVKLDVQSALGELEPSDRVVLLLRHQEGLDYRGIGEVLDCVPGTVASRLSRARERLRILLDPSYGSSEETGVPAHPIDGV
jgi:RNA polymerase sigma-70 factor (ECF subfamily)